MAQDTNRPLELGPAKREVLNAIARQGDCSIGELAELLQISDQAVRVHLIELEEEGYIAAAGRRKQAGRGRPSVHFALTDRGRASLPKKYAPAANLLLESIHEAGGEPMLRSVLEALARKRTEPWLKRLEGKSIAERVALLSDLYAEDDPYSTCEATDSGYVLTERNCPFLDVALEHPGLCSTSVSMLANLLGADVKRTQRFQNGDRQCVFVVTPSAEPIRSMDEFRFHWESDGANG